MGKMLKKKFLIELTLFVVKIRGVWIQPIQKSARQCTPERIPCHNTQHVKIKNPIVNSLVIGIIFKKNTPDDPD